MRKPCATPVYFACLVASASLALAACGEDERSDGNVKRSAPNIERLATDVHVAVAGHNLVLPFVALEDYAYRKQSFTFDPQGDGNRAIDAVNHLLRDSADPLHPLALDHLSVLIETYGWNDFDARQRNVCPLLTRAWAKSVCDNPWAAIQQALPRDSFKLVDLGRLNIADPNGPANCVNPEQQIQPLPQAAGEAVLLCEMKVYGGSDHFQAVIRIDGDLGALWYMSGKVQSGETAASRLAREGKAIVAFVRDGVGPRENFFELHAMMCGFRRPNSSNHPNQPPDCS